MCNKRHMLVSRYSVYKWTKCIEIDDMYDMLAYTGSYSANYTQLLMIICSI